MPSPISGLIDPPAGVISLRATCPPKAFVLVDHKAEFSPIERAIFIRRDGLVFEANPAVWAFPFPPE
jgi:hypothetical protein